jgi:hypothetical protein
VPENRSNIGQGTSDHVPNLVENPHKLRKPYYRIKKVKNGTTIADKSDLIIGDNKKGRCLLTDVAFPGDRNVINNEAENF